MAVWEKRKQVQRWWNIISQVSWTDGTAMDVYYWMDHSFQYSQNINTDDEMHWIKLSTKAVFTPYYSKSQLTSLWNNGIVALDVNWVALPTYFNETNFLDGWSTWGTEPKVDENYKVCPGVVFQDYFWYSVSGWTNNKTAMAAVNVANHSSVYISTPRDHTESTDESIEDPSDILLPMTWAVTAILNYNNTRLVVAAWQDIWVYYPELDINSPVTHPLNPGTLDDHGKTGWKKVLSYEDWITIVGLTCSFEYLKVWAVDEWWNTKVYYYQGNNNLRSTFVYNLVDLTGVRVTRVYNINGIDYYIASIDWTDWYVDLYKLVWDTPVKLFQKRWWLDPLDINTKAPYFVWPCWLNAAYHSWRFFIADFYGLFQFTYNPQGFDKGYMKRRLKKERNDTTGKQVYWVCENKWRIYVSTDEWCYVMRAIDTWKPPINITSVKRSQIKTRDNLTESQTKRRLDWWYQEEWVLISREYEGWEGWTVTKMLDEVRLNFEMNPLTDENWDIDIYVSPNNLWKDSNPNWWSDNRYKVMELKQRNAKTRAEKSNQLNDLWPNWNPSFSFDRQTITYAIKISRGEETHATPIVRQIDLKYHCKDKINDVYDIQNN